MIVINEWLPNPKGSDREGEWMELWNGGTERVSLRGWTLINGGGGTFRFGEREIDPLEYVVLRRNESRLTLRNQDETLSLYNADGRKVDSSSFKGTAPEGKSVSRTREKFLFAEPTPGTENFFPVPTALIESQYPAGVNLAPSAGLLETLGLVLGVAIAFTAATLYILKRNHDVEKLFFGGDQKIR